MIGHEEEQDVSYKVADKRKFNADGSLREGVTLEPAPQPKEVKQEKPSAAPEDDFDGASAAPVDPDISDESQANEADEDDDLPGAKDPASFVNFLSTLATNAAAALGAIPHPATGQRSLDLDSGKYWLDTLSMLQEKTQGNLHPKEAKLLKSLLGDLKMQYVHLVRATEEKLKERAAAKFSGEDILGKKK
jgi:hypothetical protein